MDFSDIIGHERPIRLLKAMLRAERLPHALLFSGPSGVGKRTLARALAKAVNCLGDDPENACGQCLSCGKIERNTHPDVAELEPEGRARLIKVDTIRDLRTKIGFKPYEGRVKVYIVREADRMNDESANALLKTLEEPPPQSLLILTTPEESDLLPTIVSRCLRLSLAPLPRERVVSWLETERGLTGPKARLMAAMSGGRLGRVSDFDPEDLFERRRAVMDNLAGLSLGRIAPALDWAAELAGSQDDWPRYFSLIRFWYRDLMILCGGGGADMLVNDDIAEELAGLAAGRSVEGLGQALEELDKAQDALNRFIRPELVFEDLMLTLADL